MTGLCASLFVVAGTASAAQKAKDKKATISNTQMQQAYKRLLKTPAAKKQQNKNPIAKKRKKSPARFHAVAVAKKQIRKKYRWGGSTPRKGFDCSGLTYYAFKSAKIHLPRSTSAQYKQTKRVSLSKLQAGDLIFFKTRRTRARVNHVGIYLGNGNFIHAPRRGKRVSIAKLKSRYWRRKVVGAGRV